MKTINVIKQALLAIVICVVANATAQTTYQGVRVPQLSVAERLIIGVESNPANAKGLQIFNTTTGAMEYWDGAKWNPMITSIAAENGLTATGTTLKLGGVLNQTTTINLSGNNLLFNRSYGKIGVGTTSPLAPVHIESATEDPLILKNTKWISDPKNAADAANPAYYGLRISDGGVIRKMEPIIVEKNPNQSFTYNLRTNVNIASGNEFGANGSNLYWSRGGDNYDYIELPENGAYVFALCLYGTLSNIQAGYDMDGYTYYVCLYKNGTATSNLFDIAEIVIHRAALNATSYTINMTAAGIAGDRIYFKIGYLNWPIPNSPWTLSSATSSTAANKTSMIFWKL